MHHHLLLPTTTNASMRSSSSVHHPKPKSHCNNANAAAACKHSPSATLDVLIVVVVLFSGAFLLSSYFSYIFNSLSLLLLHHHHHHHLSFPYLLAFFLFFAAAAALDFCAVSRRRCRRSGCRGLKYAMEFDLKIQTEDAVRSSCAGDGGEIERVPWKGGSEGNPEYECLRAELRKMAPPNGRALLLFRAPCGCAVAKLEGWGPKRGKRHKRSLTNATLNGRGDNR